MQHSDLPSNRSRMTAGSWQKMASLQNLRRAWKKVRTNEGGPGVDGVTLKQFERNLEQSLSLLKTELENGDFQPSPALRRYLDKSSGGRRPIGIPTIRDRVVQQSLLSVLSPAFEPAFLDCSFAYRPGRSAADAISSVGALIGNGHHWVLDGDIETFFDRIDREILLGFVSERISDSRLLELIQRFLKAGVFEGMTLRDGYLGITQGNVISPLLANIYLHPFDQRLTEMGYSVVRYADDFVILEDSQERASRTLTDAACALRDLKLNLNEEKTRILPVRDGFAFLGYYIDAKGKGPSKKAIEAVQQKLRTLNEADRRKTASDRVENLKQCVRGWSGYFHTCRGIEPSNCLDLIALTETSLELCDEEYARKLFNRRKDYQTDRADISYLLGCLAQRLGARDEALDEFTQAVARSPDHFQSKESLQQLELVDGDVYSSIRRLRRLIHCCPDMPQPYRDLASCYAEVGEYGLAHQAYGKALELDSDATPDEKASLPVPATVEPPQFSFSEEDMRRFLSLFKGREGSFARQWVDGGGRRGFYPSAGPLNSERLKAHLEGGETLGLYLITEQGSVHLAVIDIDIDNKALLQYARDEERLKELHQLTQKDARRVSSVCEELGISILIEDSGYKGRHIWLFFATPVPAKSAREFLRFILEKAGSPSGGVHWEVFPGCSKVKGKGYGPLVKLPLGIHRRTNRRCLFLDREGVPLTHQMSALSQITPIGPENLQKILLTYAAKPPVTGAGEEDESALIRNLLAGCKVISHLVDKARETHYLDNAERVTLLYILGHLGPEGKSFLHKVISSCINYDYAFTDKRIAKVKPHPISCARIREKHESIALEVGCDCTFKLPPRGYPSPILHAFAQPKTWPIKEHSPLRLKTEAARGVGSKAEISGKLRTYIELRRQLKGVERSLARIEGEMLSYFDRLETDTVETEHGMLVRRKSGDKLEWIIKL